jgi:Holliday junction DNA helicase RuvA
MIRYIKGIYSMTFENSIIVENASGIGFEIFIPAGSPLYRYGEGEEIMVYTSMAVKEDDISLYGFHNREALELFELLTTVNGIGAKAAMAILSTLSPEELRRAILFEDAKEISRANGVGKKTAERIILELKEKIGKLSGGMTDSGMSAELGGGTSSGAGDAAGTDNRVEAINALIALGYSKAEAFSAISQVPEAGLSCEDYIKKALKHLF